MPGSLADIFLSLLPARYRSRYQADPVSGTTLSGIIEAATATVIYLALFFRYLKWYGELSAAAMARAGDTGLSWEALSFGGGLLGWMAFSISPGPLLAMYAMIEGAARAISGGLTGQPLASLPFWLIGEAHGLVDRLLTRRRVAPPAPDLVEFSQPGSAWDLCVISVRSKPDWHSLVQVDYNGVLYRIASSGEELAGGKVRFRYYLKKAEDVGAFRGIVRYDPFEFWKTGGK